MSIDSFLKKGVLVKQDCSKEEIEDLLKIVERDLHDLMIGSLELHTMRP